MDILLAFSKVLRSLRHRAKLSQESLGFKAGVHRTFVGKLERGETAPTIVTMLNLAKALNISVTRFVEKVEKQTKKN